MFAFDVPLPIKAEVATTRQLKKKNNNDNKVKFHHRRS